MPLAPIALADLGASLDAALSAAALNPGGTPAYVGPAAPPLLVLKARVTGATATVRLYCYDEELGYWVPSAVAAQVLDNTVDGGLYELRFNTAMVAGYYALVQTAGAGVVSYVYRLGRN